MALVVQKFGGTSVADSKKLLNVARRVVATAAEGNQVAVVVSAMGKTTDALLELVDEITDSPNPRELDVLLSTGEQVSIALLSIAIQTLGYRSRAFTGGQVRVLTDSVHGQARIQRIGADRVLEALKEGEIPVVAGFQGVNQLGDVTTLGRGGSDLSAVALAAALSADLCEIYTDVDGVFTADPGIVPNARKLSKVSYDEMLELASLGAGVLQTRSVLAAKKFNVDLHVRSSFKPDEGTVITRENEGMEKVIVTGVTQDAKQAKLSLLRVPDQPGIASQIFGAMADAGVVIDMIVQSTNPSGFTDISVTMPRKSVKMAVDAAQALVESVGAAGMNFDENIAKVSIVGVGMRSHGGVAARMFTALSGEGINIHMISTSEIAISCVIDVKYAELAVRTLHQIFGLDAE